jgi:hypothetical protein
VVLLVDRLDRLAEGLAVARGARRAQHLAFGRTVPLVGAASGRLSLSSRGTFARLGWRG